MPRPCIGQVAIVAKRRLADEYGAAKVLSEAAGKGGHYRDNVARADIVSKRTLALPGRKCTKTPNPRRRSPYVLLRHPPRPPNFAPIACNRFARVALASALPKIIARSCQRSLACRRPAFHQALEISTLFPKPLWHTLVNRTETLARPEKNP
jgi:hypothetical protein